MNRVGNAVYDFSSLINQCGVFIKGTFEVNNLKSVVFQSKQRVRSSNIELVIFSGVDLFELEN